MTSTEHTRCTELSTLSQYSVKRFRFGNDWGRDENVHSKHYSGRVSFQCCHE